MRLVSQLPVDVRIEKRILLHVGGKIRRPGLIDLSHDSEARRKALPDQVASGLAERGDEDQLVLAASGDLAKRIVEKNRSRFRRDELVGLLQDLPQDEVEIEIASERQAALVALEKTLELRDFQRMKLDHRPNPSRILYGFLALGRERFLLQRDAAIRGGRVEASPAIAEIFAHVSPKKAQEAEATHLPNVDELMANVTVDIRGVRRNVNDAAKRQRDDTG